MNSLALLATDPSAHGLLVLLLYVILAIVVLAVIWVVTTRVAAETGMPSWVPLLILAVVVIVVLIWLVDSTG